ncbi:hypothetical protein H0H81_011562 [Sphagnurus paluster]|uniref:Peptide hydrolase n=1 Tax=Sphagnurus paluster TaxID=117069 RepID=A0A9P7GPS3_9AGAR|nr:hypothetical protein H0H81_011562 [Sphagnurus paluster]
MNSKAAWPLALLLVTPFDSSLFKDNSCLSKAFYGNYQQGNTTLSVLRPDSSCLDTWSSHALASSATISGATKEVQQLVWLEEQAVEESLKAQTRSFRNEFDAFLDTLSTYNPASEDFTNSHGQEVISNARSVGYEVLYRHKKAALLSVDHDKAKIIDTLVPRFWKSTLLPTKPVPFQSVDRSSLTHAETVLANLKSDPTIATIVDSISVSQMKKDIRFLTGEDEDSGILSRHSFSKGALTAASWLKARFEETGASCELKPFLIGFAPNVVWSISRYPSLVNTTSTVLFSAHYDSRGSFGKTRAPGADDDGSGTIALLSIARTILREGIKFHSNVELVAFAGEEQGLLGSRAYSRMVYF